MKASFKRLIKKNYILKKSATTLLFAIRRISYLRHYHQNSIDDKTIFFDSFLGKSFADSPKAIYLEMKNNPKYKDYTFIWSF